MRRSLRLIAPILLLSVGCTGPSDDAAHPRLSTQRERDSVTSTLPIPGAKGVGRALTVSDSAASRASLIDSASQD